MTDWSYPNVATPAGSAAYYSVRFSPQVLHDQLAAAFAWRAELDHIVDKAVDPGVARLKLDWWRDELQRIRAEEPRHPLSGALSALLTDQPTHTERHIALMQEMLDGVEHDIRKLQPQNDHEFWARNDAIGGAFGELLASVCASQGGDDFSAARRLGAFDEGITRITRLHASLGKNFCPLPRTTLNGTVELSISLPTDSFGARLPGTLAHLLTDATREMRNLLASQRGTGHISAIHRQAAQSVVLSLKIQRHAYRIPTEPWTLTPIRRLWAARHLR